MLGGQPPVRDAEPLGDASGSSLLPQGQELPPDGVPDAVDWLDELLLEELSDWAGGLLLDELLLDELVVASRLDSAGGLLLRELSDSAGGLLCRSPPVSELTSSLVPDGLVGTPVGDGGVLLGDGELVEVGSVGSPRCVPDVLSPLLDGVLVVVPLSLDVPVPDVPSELLVPVSEPVPVVGWLVELVAGGSVEVLVSVWPALVELDALPDGELLLGCSDGVSVELLAAWSSAVQLPSVQPEGVPRISVVSSPSSSA